MPLPERGQYRHAGSQRGRRRRLDHLAYFEALSLFKLAIILEGTYARLAADGIVDPTRNTFTEGVPRLIRYAAAFARGTRS